MVKDQRTLRERVADAIHRSDGEAVARADAAMRVIVEELRSPRGPHDPDHGYWAADYIEREWTTPNRQ